MSELKLTLQNRITTLMVISSILFIGVFTFIQINNQITNINRYNTYQANLSAAILKDNLETVIRKVPANDVSAYIQSSLVQLINFGIIKDTTIFDQFGTIVASTDDSLKGGSVTFKSLSALEKLKSYSQTGKWFLAEIDKQKQEINIYIAIKLDPQGALTYAAKSTFPFASVQDALATVYKPIFMAIILIILANIIFGYILSKTVVGPIMVLNKVSKIIADGDLTVRININTKDELEELGQTFNFMTLQLIKMKERAENANPLTKLPGNIIIQEEIEKRIQNQQTFTLVYCDLDNFKAFNDKYGIGKGDEAIKLTADVFKIACQSQGNSYDFLGHEGGDDFILITTPDKAQKVTDVIISEFDKRVRSLYNQEDLKQGYIIAHARDNSIKQFPIMTISLAGVSNENRNITSYAEATNIAAEIKKKAKAIEGSVFVMDKRRDITNTGSPLERS